MIKKTNIQVDGHRGLWYILESEYIENLGTFHLLEHQTYGEDADCVIVNDEGKLMLEDVSNGFYDFFDFLNDKDEELSFLLDSERDR